MKSDFLAQTSAFMAILFFGISLGFLLKTFLFRKNTFQKSRGLVFALTFLSLTAIFYTIMIFASKKLLPFSALRNLHIECGFSGFSYNLISLGFFVFGFFMAFFWKKILPAFILLYSFCWIFSVHSLNSFFGSQKTSLPVKIESDLVFIDGKKFKKEKDIVLEIENVTLSPAFFLPVKRNWFFVKYAGRRTDIEDGQKEIEPNYFLKIFVLHKEFKEIPVKIPEPNLLPSLYSLRIYGKEANFHSEIIKDL